MSSWDEKTQPFNGLPALDAQDWAQAFCSAKNPIVVPGSGVSGGRIDRRQVVEIRASVVGNRGRTDLGDWWIIVGRDSLGRRFALAAWCDRGGWVSRAGGVSVVADTYARLKAAIDNHVAQRHVDRVRSLL